MENFYFFYLFLVNGSFLEWFNNLSVCVCFYLTVCQWLSSANENEIKQRRRRSLVPPRETWKKNLYKSQHGSFPPSFFYCCCGRAGFAWRMRLIFSNQKKKIEYFELDTVVVDWVADDGGFDRPSPLDSPISLWRSDSTVLEVSERRRRRGGGGGGTEGEDSTNMGRKKIQISRITDERNRQVFIIDRFYKKLSNSA